MCDPLSTTLCDSFVGDPVSFGFAWEGSLTLGGRVPVTVTVARTGEVVVPMVHGYERKSSGVLTGTREDPRLLSEQGGLRGR